MRISDWSSDVCSSDLNANLASKNSFSRSTAAIRWRHEPMAQRWVAASGETFARWQIAATRYNACSQNNRPGRFVERNLLRHRRRKPYWRSEERRVGQEGVST